MKIRLFVLAVFLACACAYLRAQNQQPISLESSSQILVVTTRDWNSVDGTLQRYERASIRKPWKPVGTPITVVVGKSGLGWSKGGAMSAIGGVASGSDPIKREGDGRAPAGIFALSTAFGYAVQKPSEWRMPYLNLTASTECVDDVRSTFYNRVVDRSTVAPDWSSSERMLRSDELYRWGIVVAHNSAPPQPGDGSCIFLHIWRGPGVPTVGCTAMPQDQIESLLAWLDPKRKPLLVQLPAAEYQEMRKRWKLPEMK